MSGLPMILVIRWLILFDIGRIALRFLVAPLFVGWASPAVNTMSGDDAMARSMNITGGYLGIFGWRLGRKRPL